MYLLTLLWYLGILEYHIALKNILHQHLSKFLSMLVILVHSTYCQSFQRDAYCVNSIFCRNISKLSLSLSVLSKCRLLEQRAGSATLPPSSSLRRTDRRVLLDLPQWHVGLFWRTFLPVKAMAPNKSMLGASPFQHDILGRPHIWSVCVNVPLENRLEMHHVCRSKKHSSKEK